MNIKLLLFISLLFISFIRAERCGSNYGKCPAGQCCSKKGYCGTTAAYCSVSNGCQSGFGDCKCGKDYGKCPAGQCCSKKGYCGKTEAYCAASNGCQSGYGDCKCGNQFGNCSAGQCCSKKGYCGTTSAYCSSTNGCQSEFGECKCGKDFGICDISLCCSKKGYCGTSSAYCSYSSGCQSEFGNCRCGPGYGSCPAGQCCSKDGYCGTTTAYCSASNGCQSEYGDCKCGDEFGKCGAGQCCSKIGFCGKSTAHCLSTYGCQSEFGDCKCGGNYGNCNASRCCSKKGYCGTTSAYCSYSNGCQSEFGNCRCGPGYGSCPSGLCCSQYGYCGKTEDYCSASNGCQSEYGDCKCGDGFGKCGEGQCCSKLGFCGKTTAHCLSVNGCQSEFGECKCGGNYGNCDADRCCSKKGYCGITDSYCSTSNCQAAYGKCEGENNEEENKDEGESNESNNSSSYNPMNYTPDIHETYDGTPSGINNIPNINESNDTSSSILNYISETMEESYDELVNPYRGWFHGSITLDLTDSCDIDCNFIYAFGSVKRYKSGLQYLGIRLSEYYDSSISSEALVFLDNLLNEYKKRKEEIDPTTQLILRFYYDSGSSPSTNYRIKRSDAKLEEEMFVKKELDNGELYVKDEDINYMKKVFNPNINNNIKINAKKARSTKLSKRENGDFVYLKENKCYKYIPPDYEPDDVETIIEHIEQLSEIINKYKDIVYIHQGIFVGKWGEMQGTSHADSMESCTKIINALNNKLDPSISIAMRTPCHYRALSNEVRKLSESSYNKLIKRLSLFNDGLFNTELDTGTYGGYQSCFTDDEDRLYALKPRKEEVEFQNEICLTAPNGGEALSNTDGDKYENIYKLEDIEQAIAHPDNYNNFYVCEDHCKNIHLSYFNDEYDISVFKRWNITFSKQIYKPNWKNVSGQEYMSRHLGYRYVLRDSSFNNNTLQISIENIGFAPAYRTFQSILLLKSTTSNNMITLNIDTNNKNWSLNETITLTVNLEDNLSQLTNDNYDVYFTLYDPSINYDIRFANINEYYENYGYKIGQFINEKEQ